MNYEQLKQWLGDRIQGHWKKSLIYLRSLAITRQEVIVVEHADKKVMVYYPDGRIRLWKGNGSYTTLRRLNEILPGSLHVTWINGYWWLSGGSVGSYPVEFRDGMEVETGQP